MACHVIVCISIILLSYMGDVACHVSTGITINKYLHIQESPPERIQDSQAYTHPLSRL